MSACKCTHPSSSWLTRSASAAEVDAGVLGANGCAAGALNVTWGKGLKNGWVPRRLWKDGSILAASSGAAPVQEQAHGGHICPRAHSDTRARSAGLSKTLLVCDKGRDVRNILMVAISAWDPVLALGRAMAGVFYLHIINKQHS